MNKSIYAYMRDCAKNHLSRTAVSFYGRKFSFKKVLDYIDNVAYHLKIKGIRVGDVITVCLPNSPAALIAFYAINKVGAVVNLVHPYIPAFQLNATMDNTLSKILITYDLYLQQHGQELSKDILIIESKSYEFMGGIAKMAFKARNKVQTDLRTEKFKKMTSSGKDKSAFYVFREDEPAVYMPSGGTTGASKIIMHNCRALNELASYTQFFLSEDISNYVAMYSVLPIFHGFGLCMNMHLCMTQGLKNVMAMKFDPVRMAKAIPKEKVSILTGVPSMYQKLLDCPEFKKTNKKSIKECFVGGDQAPKSLIEEFDKVLKQGGSKSSLYVGYGLTETVTVCAVNNAAHNRPDSVGYPLPNTKFMIVHNNKVLKAGEVGEICINNPLVMLGYYQSKESPIKKINGENWLFTGDYGYLDAEGFVYFKQRIKNMIKVNGVPVYPSEVEEVIEKVEGVHKVAAIGVKDVERGEVVKVFIEPELGADEDRLKKAIAAVCSKKLVVYAQPKRIEFRVKLPINAVGKIDRKKLREEINAGEGVHNYS